MLKSTGSMGRDEEPTNAYGANQALGVARQLPSAGDLLAGKYRLERQIGRGGMSIVFAARHTTLQQPVAIKFLCLEQDESGAAVARFLHEGRAAAKIRSEHVGRVIDVDVTGAGLPYMVMEYLEGHDLAHLLQQRGPLPVDRAVDYVMQALEAVAEAHTLNIVHRDLKPSNLFVVRRADGKKEIKVIDFGISKSLGDSDHTAFTRPHSLLGSPQYMSPEQALTPTDIDRRTDLWSIGIVLYELLAGACPFEGDTYLEILKKVTAEDPPSLAASCPAVSRELERVVRRCLDDKPTSSPAFLQHQERAREAWTVNRNAEIGGAGTAYSPPSERDLERIPILRRAALRFEDRKQDRPACSATQPSAGASDDILVGAPAVRDEYGGQRLAQGPRPLERREPPTDPKLKRGSGGQVGEGSAAVAGARRPLIEFAAGRIPSLENEEGATSSGDSWIHLARGNHRTLKLESGWAKALRHGQKRMRRAARVTYHLVGRHPVLFGIGALVALAIAAVLLAIGMSDTMGWGT